MSRNRRVEWVGSASAETWYFFFMHMIGGAKGWVEDSSFPTHYMQFSYWQMIQYHIGLSGGLWTHGIDPNTWDLIVGPTHLFNNLTSDILGWDDVLLSGCVDYCQLYALPTCKSSSEIEKVVYPRVPWYPNACRNLCRNFSNYPKLRAWVVVANLGRYNTPHLRKSSSSSFFEVPLGKFCS